MVASGKWTAKRDDPVRFGSRISRYSSHHNVQNISTKGNVHRKVVRLGQNMENNKVTIIWTLIGKIKLLYLALPEL